MPGGIVEESHCLYCDQVKTVPKAVRSQLLERTKDDSSFSFPILSPIPELDPEIPNELPEEAQDDPNEDPNSDEEEDQMEDTKPEGFLRTRSWEDRGLSRCGYQIATLVRTLHSPRHLHRQAADPWNKRVISALLKSRWRSLATHNLHNEFTRDP